MCGPLNHAWEIILPQFLVSLNNYLPPFHFSQNKTLLPIKWKYTWEKLRWNQFYFWAHCKLNVWVWSSCQGWDPWTFTSVKWTGDTHSFICPVPSEVIEGKKEVLGRFQDGVALVFYCCIKNYNNNHFVVLWFYRWKICSNTGWWFLFSMREWLRLGDGIWMVNRWIWDWQKQLHSHIWHLGGARG